MVDSVSQTSPSQQGAEDTRSVPAATDSKAAAWCTRAASNTMVRHSKCTVGALELGNQRLSAGASGTSAGATWYKRRGHVVQSVLVMLMLCKVTSTEQGAGASRKEHMASTAQGRQQARLTDEAGCQERRAALTSEQGEAQCCAWDIWQVGASTAAHRRVA